MTDRYWYKIEVNKDKEGAYHYVGTSSLSLQSMTTAVEDDHLVRLDDLLYMERGEYKEWAKWDKNLEPTVLIQPSCILSIMPFKGDPRIVPAT